ncbi:MAG: acylphosphatase, partial [Hydrocarboniphaga effusa]|nr:acylphosphatase [Hydrocarboniphaga effusa]
LAQGAAQALEEFRDWLRRGPPAAQVESVEWTATEEAPQPDFSIRPSIRA